MRDFAKIYSTILDSSVWGESKDVKILWITLLAMGANTGGVIEASVGGLARRAGLTREECEGALEVLLAPDPDDKSGVDEGRRIQKTERGWSITNHKYYRDFRTDAQVQNAERQQRFRDNHPKPKKAALPGVTSVTSNGVTPHHATERADPDREGDSESEEDQPTGQVVAKDLPGSARTEAPQPPPADQSEHQATEPKLTICPLNLLEKAEAVGIVHQFVERYRVHPDQIREGIREFVSHWSIGGGAGRKESNWFKKLRHDLKFKCETPGKLKSLGELGHAELTRQDKRERSAESAGMQLMREAEALAAGATAPPPRRPQAPVKAAPAGVGAIVTDLSKALGGRV